MNSLFYLGVFFIPFDNLAFAPSKGWAAIAPLFFFTFALLKTVASPRSGGLVPSRPQAIGILCFACATLTAWTINYLEPDKLFQSSSRLVLGISFYVALRHIDDADGKWLRRSLMLLTAGYAIALALGGLQFMRIVGGPDVMSLYDQMSKRVYLDRVQFTFTEPSFIGVHLLGVVFFFVRMTRFYPGRAFRISPLLYISALIALIGIVSGSSLRLLIDLAFLVVLLMARNFTRFNLRKGAIAVGVLGVLFWLAPAGLLERLNRMTDTTETSTPDVSAEIRKFRANAVLSELKADPATALFGAGFSNIWLVFSRGYSTAYEEYKGAVFDEVDGLKDNPESSIYNMHLKLMGELGVLGYIAILLALFKRRLAFEYAVILWLYLQFDSYAFYPVWIYLFMNYKDRRLPFGGGLERRFLAGTTAGPQRVALSSGTR